MSSAGRFDGGRLQRRLRRFADRIGPVGLIGAAMLAACAGYYAGSIEPQRQQLEALREEAQRPAAPRTQPNAVRDAAVQLTQFADGFPESSQLAALLGALYAIGEREGVHLVQGEYRLVDADALGVLQYKMILPVAATYPNLRRFVAAALGELPSLAITQINMQRDRIGQGRIEARFELTLYLRASPLSVAGRPAVPAKVSRGPEMVP